LVISRFALGEASGKLAVDRVFRERFASLGPSKFLQPRQSPMQCASCEIRRRALFQVVPSEYIQDAQTKRTHQYDLPARRHLYEEGQEASMAYTLYDGWMLLYRAISSGGRQGLRIALPGDFIGFMPEGEAAYHHSALAVSNVVLCGFGQSDLHEMIDRHSQLSVHINRIQSRYMASCQDAMLGLGRKTAEQRIAHLIAELYFRLLNRHSLQDGETSMPFPLTQELLGDMTGLTAVHTNRVMRKLREEGVLEPQRQRLDILDLEKLVAIGELRRRDVE